jgi:hypothetical protein
MVPKELQRGRKDRLVNFSLISFPWTALDAPQIGTSRSFGLYFNGLRVFDCQNPDYFRKARRPLPNPPSAPFCATGATNSHILIEAPVAHMELKPGDRPGLREILPRLG